MITFTDEALGEGGFAHVLDTMKGMNVTVTHEAGETTGSILTTNRLYDGTELLIVEEYRTENRVTILLETIKEVQYL